MYKYILAEAGNINWMAIFALLTFFSLFIISSVAIFGRSKDFIHKMSNLPIEENVSNKK